MRVGILWHISRIPFAVRKTSLCERECKDENHFLGNEILYKLGKNAKTFAYQVSVQFLTQIWTDFHSTDENKEES